MFTQEEFLIALASFGEIIPDSIEYRFYYNDQGDITMCSYQNHPQGTQYLIVDQETYNNYIKYRINVKQKKLEKIAIDPGISVNLKSSDQGYKVVRHHAGLLLESNETYKDIEYYESINRYS